MIGMVKRNFDHFSPCWRWIHSFPHVIVSPCDFRVQLGDRILNCCFYICISSISVNTFLSTIIFTSSLALFFYFLKHFLLFCFACCINVLRVVHLSVVWPHVPWFLPKFFTFYFLIWIFIFRTSNGYSFPFHKIFLLYQFLEKTLGEIHFSMVSIHT